MVDKKIAGSKHFQKGEIVSIFELQKSAQAKHIQKDRRLCQFLGCKKVHNPAHRTRVSVIRREIYQCWNWYGSDLQTLEDQAHQVLKKFHDVDPR